MCVVLIIPKEVRPSLETLRLCERANPHGGGIAWRRSGSVEWIKTNDVAEIDKLARKMTGELVVHFRIASVGGVCDELRHPFPVTKNSRLDDRGRTGAVLFQNGTWGGYVEALRYAESEGHKIPAGEMSDARAAAFLVSIYGHKFLAKCGASRWVYMSGTETIRYGDWYKRDGIYFSNLYWLPPAPPKRQETNSRWVPTGNHKGKQPELPMSDSDDVGDLYDLTPVSDYWARVSQHRPLAKGEKPCNCCEGTGSIDIASERVRCPLCHGSRVQPKETA